MTPSEARLVEFTAHLTRVLDTWIGRGIDPADAFGALNHVTADVLVRAGHTDITNMAGELTECLLSAHQAIMAAKRSGS